MRLHRRETTLMALAYAAIVAIFLAMGAAPAHAQHNDRCYPTASTASTITVRCDWNHTPGTSHEATLVDTDGVAHTVTGRNGGTETIPYGDWSWEIWSSWGGRDAGSRLKGQGSFSPEPPPTTTTTAPPSTTTVPPTTTTAPPSTTTTVPDTTTTTTPDDTTTTTPGGSTTTITTPPTTTDTTVPPVSTPSTLPFTGPLDDAMEQYGTMTLFGGGTLILGALVLLGLTIRRAFGIGRGRHR